MTASLTALAAAVDDATPNCVADDSTSLCARVFAVIGNVGARSQYGSGDVVDLGEACGTVEGVGLRITRLRDVDGAVAAEGIRTPQPWLAAGEPAAVAR